MHGAELESLVRPLLDGEADYTKGNRLAFPRARTLMPWPRWAANHLLSLLTRWATGARVWDSQCGYTAMARRAFEGIDVDKVWPSYGYPNDLIAKMTCAGMRVRDVVVRPVYGDETSGIRWWHAILVVPCLLVRAATRRALFRRAPLAGTRLAVDP